MNVVAARKRLERDAQKPCTTCKERAPEACSNGVHWARAIVAGEMPCCQCTNVGYVAYNGQIYCPDHFVKLDKHVLPPSED
jgi:hypothetical protein